ncbi:hypothetical protein KDL01_08710 [Actinospica durhamensis]|uniref:Uncharacterized protein n=1 Tax=Actinospica durhamensis TaxID=1508375 RepID=A0A941ET34_9ACTN|nr:hypothetical protein [Actinospica durhamensis]MBR7833344.1 hypothetical protein [Actinospica durhamensis]
MSVPESRPPLRRGRAVGTFAGAYAAVTVVCPLFYWALAELLHKPLVSGNPFHDPTYVLAQKFYPLLNLAVWSAFALLYLRRGDRRQAFALGRLWLCLALPVDFVGFVLIHNPMSLSPYDFYVSQFPWIYLTYAAVFLGPLCGARIAKVSDEV